MKDLLPIAYLLLSTATVSAQELAPNGPVEAQIDNPPTATGQGVGASGVLDLTGDVRRPRNADEQFLAAASSEFPELALARPVSDLDRTIIQGTIIPAVLETAVQSDLPGVIRAIVSEDIRAFDGSVVLVPKGARLFGTYRADLKLYQNRALILWTRLVTPDGLSIMIGSRGVDRLGRAGQTGYVDTHFDERFGSAALISLIGATPAVAAASVAEEESGATQAQIISDITGNFQDATSSVVADYLTIKPTIYIDQGAVLNVMTERDIVFPFY